MIAVVVGEGEMFSGELLILTMIVMATRFLRTSGEDMNIWCNFMANYHVIDQILIDNCLTRKWIFKPSFDYPNDWNSSTIAQGYLNGNDLPGRALFIVTSFCTEFQHGQHLSSWEGKKEVTKGKEGKESGQSGGQSSAEGKLLQDIGWAHSDIHTTSHLSRKPSHRE